MNLQLSEKEKTLLQDQLKHESICIQKYTNYAAQASDPELQQLFSSLASQEQQHYSTIEKILNGQQPNIGQNQSQIQQNQNQDQYQSQQNTQAANMQYEQADMSNEMASQGDTTLCTDMLMTEKFVSGSYDTAVFESKNPQVVQALQHIQKEEQEHGQKIQKYLNSKGLQ
ncbi:MAG TPA: spore coat protein [Clostridia bacterium]|jgi:rubrerythrin|nr:spore coat protein [Clostridia bacterium]